MASPARVPRKALRRRLHVLLLLTLFLAYLLLLHYLHPPPYPPISPHRPLNALPAIPRNIYYLPHAPVLYCYIPKNACSRFKTLFRKRAGFQDWDDPALVHGRRNGLPRLSALSSSRAIARLGSPHVTRFVVVRDPFARLVSAYQNKIAAPWPDQRADFWEKHLGNECPAMIAARVMPTEGPLLSLEEFLECLLTDDAVEVSNEHWRLQTDLCGLEYVKYDVYLRLETLQSDVRRLLAVLGWKENMAAFEMDRKPVFSRPLAAFFSEKAVKLALRYYDRDFEVLKYPRRPQGMIHFYSVFNGTNFQPGFVPHA